MNQNNNMRKGMKIITFICFILALIYAILPIGLGISFMFSMTAFFGVLGVMFFILAKSPKESLYI